jgi:hypothetical protein
VRSIYSHKGKKISSENRTVVRILVRDPVMRLGDGADHGALILSLRGVAAVDRDGGASDEVRRRARKEDGDAGQVLGHAPAAGRRFRRTEKHYLDLASE